MNKNITRVLTLISCLLFLPIAAAYGEIGINGIYYELHEHEAEVIRISSVEDDVVIPGVITVNGENYTVTSIADFACTGNSHITSIKFPSSVTKMGICVFGDLKTLLKVHSLGSVTTIPNDTFEGCSALEEVVIPTTVTSIGGFAFSGCHNLSSIQLPGSLTEIGKYCFEYCEALTSVVLPKSLADIGSSIFSNCGNLMNIYVEDGNPDFCSVDGIVFSKDMTALVLFPTGRTEAYTVPGTVTDIRDGAFGGCPKLTGVALPGNLKRIGEEAFAECIALTEINLPVSLNSIGYAAFGYCTGLRSIVIPPSVTFVEECLFDGCEGLRSVTLPNTCKAIKIGAFAGCSSLTDIVIPNSCETIGYQSFVECNSLTEINIPASVTEIEIDDDGTTFMRCRNLKAIHVDEGNVKYSSLNGVLFNKDRTKLVIFPEGKMEDYTIPNTVECIGVLAFHQSQLSRVVIPSSIVTIEESAFSFNDWDEGEALKAIYSLNAMPPTCLLSEYGDTPFRGLPETSATLYVPNEAVEAYKSAEGWKDFQNIVGIDPTGIEDVKVTGESRKKENVIYDLSGRRLNQPKRGVNIVNGKKVMMNL